jgi:hypothetical protein
MKWCWIWKRWFNGFVALTTAAALARATLVTSAPFVYAPLSNGGLFSTLFRYRIPLCITVPGCQRRRRDNRWPTDHVNRRREWRLHTLRPNRRRKRRCQLRAGHAYSRRTSTDGGATFGPPADVTSEVENRYLGDSLAEVVQGQTIDQVYRAHDETYVFRRSDDGGITFTDPETVTQNSADSGPELVATGDHVYVIYQEAGSTSSDSGPVFIQGSLDRGETWTDPVLIHDNAAAFDLAVSSSGGVVASLAETSSYVFVAYPDGVVNNHPVVTTIDGNQYVVGASGIYLRSSWLKAGVNDEFAAIWKWTNQNDDTAVIMLVSSDAGLSWHAHILNDMNSATQNRSYQGDIAPAADGSWFTLWTEVTGTTAPTIYFAQTSSDGQSISSRQTVHLTHNGTRDGPWIRAFPRGNAVNILWTEDENFSDPTLVQFTSIRGGHQPIDPPVIQKLDDQHAGAFVQFEDACPSGGICSGSEADAQPQLFVSVDSTSGPAFLSFAPLFLTGDGNCDGHTGLGDMLSLLSAQSGGNSIPCPAAADTNCDHATDVKDALVYLYAEFGLTPPGFPDSCPLVGT